MLDRHALEVLPACSFCARGFYNLFAIPYAQLNGNIPIITVLCVIKHLKKYISLVIVLGLNQDSVLLACLWRLMQIVTALFVNLA